MQQDFGCNSNDEMKIVVVGIIGVGSIDMGSNSSNEMKIAAIGSAGDGLIGLYSDSGNKMNILVGVALKMRIAPKWA